MNRLQHRSFPLFAQRERIFPSPHSQKSWHLVVLLTSTLLLLTGGTILWVLNSIGIISGPWATVFSAIFTALGIMITVLDSLLTAMKRRQA